MVKKHLGEYIIPYIFENSNVIEELQSLETIEEEDIDDLHFDLVDFLKSCKESKNLDIPSREFIGIQADILEGELTYSLMMTYLKAKNTHIIMNVRYNHFRLDGISGTILHPDGLEDSIALYGDK